MNAYLDALRSAELRAALDAAKHRGGKVLEIGAADGFLARELAAHFGAVEAVDIEPAAEQRYPVCRYDGVHLPFANAAFDLVFSSHVMEHVRQFDELQVEIKRVLKPGGIAVHVLPTATWRLWTSLAHYPALIGFALGRKLGQGQGARFRRKSLWQMARKIIAASRHGETGSALSELWTFRQAAWRVRFRTAGWNVLATRPARLFYTGYVLFGSRLTLPARRRLAALFGSSSVVLMLAPASSA
jgi:SAM-dependent methyltransferase